MQKALVAVDLHGTIADKTGEHSGEYDPAAYELQPGAVEALKELRDDGHEVAIWTCWATEEARAWLDANGVPYDYVNEEAPDHGSPKIDAQFYVDDKAVFHNGDWNHTLAKLQSRGLAEKSMTIRIKSSGKFTAHSGGPRGTWWVKMPDGSALTNSAGSRRYFKTREEAERAAEEAENRYASGPIGASLKTAHEVACPECGGGGCDFCNDAGTIRTADDKSKRFRYVGKSRTGGQVWYRS